MTTTHVRRTLAALAVALLAALQLALTTSPAAAHASLVSMTPGVDSTTDGAPESVTLTFSEDVRTPAFVTVTTADGTEVNDGRVRVEGTDVVQDVAVTDNGPVTVAYRVVSADGHPIEGEESFTVRGVAAEEPSDPESSGAAEPSEPADAAPSASADAADAAEDGSDAEPAAQTSDDEGTSWTVPVLIGVAVLAAVGVLLTVARRRGQS